MFIAVIVPGSSRLRLGAAATTTRNGVERERVVRRSHSSIAVAAVVIVEEAPPSCAGSPYALRLLVARPQRPSARAVATDAQAGSKDNNRQQNFSAAVSLP